ncbi:Rab proteins geranylgeranyltransferase component A 2, partial [Ophiophagus hannah]
CKAVIDHFGQRINASYFVVEDSYLSEKICKNISYRFPGLLKNWSEKKICVDQFPLASSAYLLVCDLYIFSISTLCFVKMDLDLSSLDSLLVNKEAISILTIPPQEKGQPAVCLVELCSSAMICMKNTCE